MATTLIGTRTTGNITATRRVLDMSNRISLLQPEKTPLVVLLMRLRKKKAINPEYAWLEDDLIPRTSATVDSGGASIVTIVVTTGEGSYFRVNDVVKNTTTGEVMLVTGISTDTLTIVRGLGGSAAVFNLADELLILGNAAEEYDVTPTIKTTITSRVFNYIQTFRNPFGASTLQEKSELYGGGDRNYQRKKVGIEHMVDLERSFWFGEPYEDTAGAVQATPQRTTGGVTNYVTTNITTLGTGGLTEATMNDFIRTGMRYGNRTKFLFASPLGMTKIDGFANGKLRLMPKDKTLGLAISRWVTSHGDVNIVRTVIFEGATYDEWSFLLDMENVAMRVMEDTQLWTDTQENNRHGWQDEWISSVGFEIKSEKTHSILKNIDGSAS